MRCLLQILLCLFLTLLCLLYFLLCRVGIIVHCWNNRLDPLYYSQIIIPHCVSVAKPSLPHTALDSPLNWTSCDYWDHSCVLYLLYCHSSSALIFAFLSAPFHLSNVHPTPVILYCLSGHVCLTDDDKDNAKNNKGSLLYGELLPRGANKVSTASALCPYLLFILSR